jgi:hypothetical protein
MSFKMGMRVYDKSADLFGILRGVTSKGAWIKYEPPYDQKAEPQYVVLEHLRSARWQPGDL